jgi:hypothetical protein
MHPKALHTLFADTRADESRVLLTDDQATGAEIRSALGRLSAGAGADAILSDDRCAM